jgi:hypothetical protein
LRRWLGQFDPDQDQHQHRLNCCQPDRHVNARSGRLRGGRR